MGRQWSLLTLVKKKNEFWKTVAFFVKLVDSWGWARLFALVAVLAKGQVSEECYIALLWPGTKCETLIYFLWWSTTPWT